MNKYSMIREGKVLYCHLPKHSKVISTSVLNGGIHDDIELVFNLDCKPAPGEEIILEGGKYESHLRWYAEEKLGISADKVTGYLTAAQMDNAASVTISSPFSVTAVVTAGIDKNGSRVGEDAHWHEQNGEWSDIGTINIMLFISANLTDGALTRALVTCTEAKTAAIQELCLPSCYSNGLATGSGTDGTIIVSDMDSPLILTEAGKHTKLGELIGKCVKQAVREALIRQTGVSPENVKNVFHHLGRYGFSEETMMEELKNRGIADKVLQDWAWDPVNVNWAALEAHLLDLYQWGMIGFKEYQDSEKRLKRAFFPCCAAEGEEMTEVILRLCLMKIRPGRDQKYL